MTSNFDIAKLVYTQRAAIGGPCFEVFPAWSRSIGKLRIPQGSMENCFPLGKRS